MSKPQTSFQRSQRAARQIIADATPPARCGHQIPAAPARGPMIAEQQREVRLNGDGAPVVRAMGEVTREDGRLCAARVADAFDVMQCRADKRAPDAPPLFTTAQINAARAYAALFERYAASGVRCTSLETEVRGDGAGGDYIDAVLRDGRRLEQFKSAIASVTQPGPDGQPAPCPGGWALSPQRAAPNRDQRAPIELRVLVDQVCLGGRTLSAVLAAKGWSRSPKNKKALKSALCAALDAMRDI